MKRVLLAVLALCGVAQGQGLTPTISSLSPNSATAGSAALTLTVTGTNLVIPNNPTPIVGVVLWNGVALAAAPSPAPTATQLTVIVPANLLASPGTASITVQLLGGVYTSAPAIFTILAAPTPVIGSLSPNSAVAGSPGLALTVSGSNLAHTSLGTAVVTPGTVFWNATALQLAASPPPSTTQLTVIVPASLLSNPGLASVTVQLGNRVSAPATFTVYSPLAIGTTTLPDGTAGTAYNQTLTASGGIPPYSWSVTTNTFVPGLTLNSSSGAITGTPTTTGSFTFTIQVMDRIQGAASRRFSITIAPPAPVITTLTPDSATAGSGPLTLLVAGANLMTSGNPPATGVVLWNGTALQAAASPAPSATQLAAVVPANLLASAGSASVTVQVGSSASAPATFTITAPPLAVATTSLPNGTVGATYSQTLSASGGVTPYVWSITGGALPPGLVLNGTTGAITGAPTTLGSSSFTVQVTDTRNATASRQLSIAAGAPPAPSATIDGLSDTASGAGQIAFSLGLSSGYPLPLTAHFTLTFSPDAVAPADDPAVQFAAGGRAIDVAIPAGTAQSPNVPFQTGTVAGTITVTLTGLTATGADITPSPALTRTVRINRAAPMLTANSLRVTRRANGFDVQVSGFSTPREVTQALFHFGAAAGTKLQGADVTIPLTSAFSAWYTNSTSAQFGSAFLYTQPFTVQGDPTKINSVSVTLSNSQGGSQILSANF